MPILTNSGPVVSVEEAKEYGKTWTRNGLVVPFEDYHYEFAANFCSVMLKGFMQFMAQMAKKAMEESKNEISQSNIHVANDQ